MKSAGSSGVEAMQSQHTDIVILAKIGFGIENDYRKLISKLNHIKVLLIFIDV